jgi:hypothetical protein
MWHLFVQAYQRVVMQHAASNNRVATHKRIAHRLIH